MKAWCVAVMVAALSGATTVTAEAFDGRLVDARTGAPIAGATVTITGLPGAARTDADGRFTWRPDPRPPFTLIVVLPDGRLAKPVFVETMDRMAVLTVRAEVAVSEEVTVAAGVAPSIDAAPGAGMTLVGGADIAARAPANLLQALENVPGVNRVSEGQAAVPAIRGLARGRTLILLDGGRVSSERRVGPSATFLDPSSIAGIDVARGPGSVAYGSDALGGVISVRTRRPDHQRPLALEFSGTLGAGIPDQRASVVVSRGFGTGGVLFQYHARNTEDYDGPDGEIFNSGWSDQGFVIRAERQYTSGLLSVGWQSDFGNDIERPRNNSRTVRFYYPYEDSHRLTVGFDTPGIGNLDRVTVSGLFGTYDQRTDQDRFPTPTTARSIERADISANDFQVRATAEKLVSDVQLEFGFDLNGRVGLEAHDIAVAYDLAGAEAGVTDNLSIDSASRTDTGLFLQAVGHVGPAVLLSGGLRGDVVRNVNHGGFFGDRSITNGALAGFAAATVGPFEGVTFTGQVSRGFRDPTLSDRFYRGPSGRGFITGSPDLEPETSLQYDFNTRYAMSRVRLAAYVYHYRIHNLVERFSTGGDNFEFRNRGRAHITGFELEGQVDLGRGYSLELATSISEGSSPDDDEPLDDIGQPSLSVVFRKALAERGTAFLRVASYADDDRPGPSEVAMPGWVDVGAGASWRFSPNFEVRAAARNLLNQAYYASPDARWVYAPGRSVSVTLVAGY